MSRRYRASPTMLSGCPCRERSIRCGPVGSPPVVLSIPVDPCDGGLNGSPARRAHRGLRAAIIGVARSRIEILGRFGGAGVLKNRQWCPVVCACGLLLSAWGCTETGAPTDDRGPDTSSAGGVDTSSAKSAAKTIRRRGPVQLGGATDGTTTATGDAVDGEGGLDVVMDRMKPLQILLGQWRGITRKEQALVPQQWIWDLKTDPDQPALVLKSAESPYFRDGRLTWLAREKAFEFSGINSQGKRQVLRGNFSQPPRQVAGDADDQPQMTFKLELTETGETRMPTGWKLVLNQQENNRMLVELSRRRGRGMFRLEDTIGCQREGTSFALSDTDYGEKTCVISQGLGTTPVSYKGKTYWVCCSGCKAAFEEEPEKWIARFEAMKAKKSSR